MLYVITLDCLWIYDFRFMTDEYLNDLFSLALPHCSVLHIINYQSSIRSVIRYHFGLSWIYDFRFMIDEYLNNLFLLALPHCSDFNHQLSIINSYVIRYHFGLLIFDCLWIYDFRFMTDEYLNDLFLLALPHSSDFNHQLSIIIVLYR